MTWRPLVAVPAACVVLFTGCRGPAVTVIPKSELPQDVYSPTPSPSPTVGQELLRIGTVYMVNKGRLFGVSLKLPSAQSESEALLAALLEGVPPEGAPPGVRATSAIPPGTRAIDVGVVGSVATVNLSQEFKRGAARRTLAIRVAQVVYTLTEDPEILSVVFAFEGTPAPVFSGDERVLERPVGRMDYARFAPAEEGQADEGGMS